jgi:hypothetical protein
MTHGHAPGHIRATFLEAVEAYVNWSAGDQTPTVTREIRYEPHQIGLADACRLVWNCTDVLPGQSFNALKYPSGDIASHLNRLPVYEMTAWSMRLICDSLHGIDSRGA